MSEIVRMQAVEPILYGVLKITWQDGFEAVVDLPSSHRATGGFGSPGRGGALLGDRSPRMRGDRYSRRAAQRPVEPNPPVARCEDGSSSTASKAAVATGRSTSWAMRSPRWTS